MIRAGGAARFADLIRVGASAGAANRIGIGTVVQDRGNHRTVAINVNVDRGCAAPGEVHCLPSLDFVATCSERDPRSRCGSRCCSRGWCSRSCRSRAGSYGCSWRGCCSCGRRSSRVGVDVGVPVAVAVAVAVAIAVAVAVAVGVDVGVLVAVVVVLVVAVAVAVGVGVDVGVLVAVAVVLVRRRSRSSRSRRRRWCLVAVRCSCSRSRWTGRWSWRWSSLNASEGMRISVRRISRHGCVVEVINTVR